MAPFHAHPCRETLPVCPACGGLLRQHVLLFDEYYDGHRDYQWPRVQQAASEMDFGLFVGTSFAVGVTDLFLSSGVHAGTPMCAVDPGAKAPPHPDVALYRERSETFLPAVCDVLGIAMNRP